MRASADGRAVPSPRAIVVAVNHLVKGAEGGERVAGRERLAQPRVVPVVHLGRARVGEADVEEQRAEARKLRRRIEGPVADGDAREIDSLARRRDGVALEDGSQLIVSFRSRITKNVANVC